jgi:hypothetical protein
LTSSNEPNFVFLKVFHASTPFPSQPGKLQAVQFFYGRAV